MNEYFCVEYLQQVFFNVAMTHIVHKTNEESFTTITI